MSKKLVGVCDMITVVRLHEQIIAQYERRLLRRTDMDWVKTPVNPMRNAAFEILHINMVDKHHKLSLKFHHLLTLVGKLSNESLEYLYAALMERLRGKLIPGSDVI